MLTVQQVPAHSGWVLLRSQWVLDAVDQVTEVVKGLKDLGSLVQHGEVYV